MVNGQPFFGTGFLLDGTDNRDPILGIIVINPVLDSVQEFKIVTNSYDAQYGRTAGGVINVSLKSGTNSLHAASVVGSIRTSCHDRTRFSLCGGTSLSSWDASTHSASKPTTTSDFGLFACMGCWYAPPPPSAVSAVVVSGDGDH